MPRYRSHSEKFIGLTEPCKTPGDNLPTSLGHAPTLLPYPPFQRGTTDGTMDTEARIPAGKVLRLTWVTNYDPLKCTPKMDLLSTITPYIFRELNSLIYSISKILHPLLP